MKKLLSHNDTKDELTVYLSEKLLEQARKSDWRVIVSYRNICESNVMATDHLNSTQEEADTKLILHAMHAAKIYRVTNVDIVSSDTDVLVLTIRRCKDLSPTIIRFVTKNRTIPINELYTCLGEELAASLSAFHAFTGADITCSFSGKGKVKCWKAFVQCEDAVIRAFQKLGCSTTLDPAVIESFEK